MAAVESKPADVKPAKKANDKKKGTTISLTTIIKPAGSQKPSGSMNWADETEKEEHSLPTAPGEFSSAAAHRPTYGPPLPETPPFKVYVTNLPFDVSAESVGVFFYEDNNMRVLEAHVTKHMDTGKVKGCFITFETQDDLARALGMQGQMFAGRPLKIELAKDAGQAGRGHGDRDRDYGGRYQDRPPRGGYGHRDDYRGGDRDYRMADRGYGDRSGPRDAGDFGRGFERNGGYGGGPGEGFHGGGGRGYDEGPRGGYADRRGGYGGRGGDDRGFPPEREQYGGFSGREGGADMDGRWGRQAPMEEPARVAPPPPPQQARPPVEVAKERPKLQLQPRSKPIGEEDPNAPAPVEKKKANPFGEAKPIDAAAKLREFEERLAKRKAEEQAALKAEREAQAAAAAAAAASAPSPSAEGGPPPHEHKDRAAQPVHPGPREEAEAASPSPSVSDRGRGRGRGSGPGRGRQGPSGGRGGRAVPADKGPPPVVEAADVSSSGRGPAGAKTDADGFQEVRAHGTQRAWARVAAPSDSKAQGSSGGQDKSRRGRQQEGPPPPKTPPQDASSGGAASQGKEGSHVAQVSNIFSLLNTENE